MKKIWIRLFFASGWLLLILFLISGYFYQKYSFTAETTPFIAIPFEGRLALFEGAVSCSLTGAEFTDRVEKLKQEIFSKLKSREETADGYIYYFEDEGNMAESILEMMVLEKQCCPFFKFDLSILPFRQGIALQLSGSPAVKDFLQDFEADLLGSNQR